ncbi:TonB-dependent receptor plug domain-containing protein [Sphingomonas canadensis]|uniref:TonB-dependent receptor plug domain-containing protein n=1 Tax=Sphingomonas canadensis TaxID=1219257 RepID=A0ABW3H5A9_9SPHN|nr:TonB-dependent receptor [Sphingomonas canadensis]MCW3836543.1 TonB-dependent receptor [Sphingomonas canadensis]
MGATAIAGSLLLIPSVAFAQDDSAAASQDEGASSEEAADEPIVVVGSRIKRDTFNLPEPVTVITKAEATLAGFNSTTNALQSTAVTNGASQINNAYGGYVTNGGPGANTLSLRGLGATRTLIMLNGRRVAPAGSRGSVGSADLNVLPTAIINRIEVLKAGASSIYGSDAVAGVVNIVTETKFEGITLEAQHNVTEEGGGNEMRYAAVFGFNGDRFSVAGSLEYYKRDELTWGQRDWMQCQTQYRMTSNGSRVPGSGDAIDPLTGKSKCYPTGSTGESGVTVNTIGTNGVSGAAVALAPGVPAGYAGTCNRFRPKAGAGGGIPGYECVGGGSIGLNVRDTFDQRMLNQSLYSPAEILTGYLQGSYKMNALGDAEIYVEALFNRRKSEQNGFRQFTLDYLKGSPLIPAELQFSTFGAAGTSTANPSSVIGVRAFTAYGNYNNRQQVDFAKLGGGIRGDLPAGWSYDFYVSKTWSDADYTTDLILTDRLGQSMDVVASGGGFACRDTTGGCIAAPALTASVVGGNFPAAWFNYVTDPVTGVTKYSESVANLTFTGPLFTLPGGDLQVALGGEFRRSSISDQPSPESVRGNLYGFTSSQPTVGTDEVWELFGEIDAPLLREVPFVYDLSINASGRYTHYRSYGGDETYKLGAVYAPVKWLSFRGSYGTSYRAPALFEQYLGATSGFLSQTVDPCYNYGAGFAATDTRYINCASEGLAPDFLQTSSVTTFAGGGSATGLKAETSTNWSVGGVLRLDGGMDAWGNLSFAADYFSIVVKNGVARAGASGIASLCYDDPQFRAGGGYCNLITRNSVTKALTINDNYVNLSEDRVRGIDFNLRYQRQVGPGQLLLNVAATKYYSQANRLFPTDPLDEYNGSLNSPDWTGTLDATYRWDIVTLRYGLDYIKGQQSYDLYGLNPATTPYYFETPDVFYHQASVQVALSNYQLTMGVRNLTNKTPPSISSGAYNRVGNAPLYSGYDYLGRTFFVNASVHF